MRCSTWSGTGSSGGGRRGGFRSTPRGTSSSRWSQGELPEPLVRRLRGRLRVHQGRDGEPTAVIVDSQIARAGDTVGRSSRGFHGGKKINGRGRHAAVDAEG